MVFESIVADLLNRFLGDFVENLNASQLNIGILGGDVKLEQLQVKETALDDFDLPIKLKYGYLSSLVLKIPWKNLYNEPVIANIDGLNLIVVPNKGVVYNEEKAKKNAADIKQKTLARLEEARKNRRKPPDPVADSFAEKMITQIIKNLQVTISNIHVRFEDKYTNRHRPFCMGVTMEKLDFQTTDSNWKPTIHKEAVKIIYKLVSLQNLAMYWNSDSKLISDLTDKDEIRKKLQETIHRGKGNPSGFKYILEPIQMQAHLKLNQKPENDGTDWKTPKIDLSVDMKSLSLAIGKFQYQDILLYLEGQERFQLAGQYLKHRPNLNEYKGHYKAWWKFAYTAILEEKVRRRRKNWSWPRMKAHRQLVREYKTAWVKHQTEKSLDSHTQEIIKKAEAGLDVFNVNVARHQAEVEIDRKGLTRLEDQPQGWVAWGKSWFGGSGSTGEQKKGNADDIASKFQEAMTPEEKAKLFEAIDYQENMPPTDYPKNFVENKVQFKLGETVVAVDGAVSLKFLQIETAVQMRPSAGAVNVIAGVRELQMDGCGTEMLRVADNSQPWLSFLLDTKPLKGDYDQLIRLAVSPVNLKYHAPAVNNAIEVFKPPESVKLNQILAAAMSRYEDVKARSATGLAHAVENRSKLVLDITVNPARIFVSEGGVFDKAKPTMVADLGKLTLKTVDSNEGHDLNQSKLDRLKEQAYDKFNMILSNVVIAYGEHFDKVVESLSEKESTLHFLKPTGLDIHVHKCSIDDLQLAKLRILGDLPDIVLSFSDKRLIMLAKLLLSIPKPPSEPEPDLLHEVPAVKDDVTLRSRAKMRTIMEAEEIDDGKTTEGKEKDEEKEKSMQQQVQLEVDLKLNQVGVIVSQDDKILCDISIRRMGCKLQMRTFDMVVDAELGSIHIVMPTFKSLNENRPHLYLIDNSESHGALMTLKFVQANPASPFFATEYKMTEQAIDFNFTTLTVALHQQGLMKMKAFAEELQGKLAELQSPEENKKLEIAMTDAGRKLSRRLSQSISSLANSPSDANVKLSRESRKRTTGEETVEDRSKVIKLRALGKITSLQLIIGKDSGVETKLTIALVDVAAKMTEKETAVSAALQAIQMEDKTPGALYSKLLSVVGDKTMLTFSMKQYQRTEEEKKKMLPTDIDMEVKLQLAQMRFVFVNLWLCRLMAWVAPFQNEAQRAAEAAQAIAAEKAAAAAENVKQMMESSPPRIQLDVTLESPQIIVPRSSNSLHALVVHLGKIGVANKIMGDKNHSKAVMDRMDVKLTDMQFGICRVKEHTMHIESTCNILKPLTFSIAVHRNLMFGVVKDIPEIAVDAQLPSIELEMSEDDYKTIMQTLSGNLAEGKDLLDEAVPPPPPAITQTVAAVEETDRGKMKSGDKSATPGAQSGRDRIASTGPPASEFTRILFQFTLSKISIVLYTGVSTTEVRDPKNAFASMRIEGLKLSGKILENTTLSVAISLDVFTMNDERKDKTKIHQLLDKKHGHEKERLLDLSFSQNEQQDKNIKLKMSAFFLCLCPEFLGCITRFFTVPPDHDQLPREEALQAKTKAAQQQTARANAAAAQQQPQGLITLDCNMQGVEVLLVEDSMRPESSQALVLSFNVKMSAEPNPELQTVKGGIEGLAIYSSYYAPSRRNEITYEMLKPMNIGIDMKMVPSTHETDVLLTMSKMEVRMSPSIIRLLSTVNAEFAKASAVEPSSDKSTSEVVKTRTYSNYWQQKPINFRKYWFFATPVAEEAVEDEAEEQPKQGDDPSTRGQRAVEKAKVEIERISFTLESGTETIPVPLIFLDIAISAQANSWSSALNATADMSMQMSYYNEALNVWEPVIEQVEMDDGSWERWSIRAVVNGRNKLDPDDTSPNMDVKVTAEKMLNVTVTKSFLSLLNKLSEVFASAAKQISPPLSRHLPGKSPFILLNDTGLIVRVLESDDIDVGGQTHGIEATHGSFVDLVLKKAPKADVTLERLNLEQEELRATLRLELDGAVRELTIGRAQKTPIYLPKYNEARKQWMVIAETSIENGRRLVHLVSHVQLFNHLSVPMELYSKRDTSLDLFGTVPPNESMHLAVPLLYSPTGEIFFKPAGDKFEVSYEALTWHKFVDKARQPLRCDLSDDNTKGFFFDTLIKQTDLDETSEKPSFAYDIHLHYPLVFHNVLPFSVHMTVPEEKTIESGDDITLQLITGHKFKLWLMYQDEKYVLDMPIPHEKSDLQVVALNTESGSEELLLGVHWTSEYGHLKLYLYAPFWLVNNTGLTLRHMEGSGGLLPGAKGCIPCRGSSTQSEEESSAVLHPADSNPIILPYPSDDLARKKKAKVQVEGASSFSEMFPLDTVGNPARVVCKGKDRDYEMTVDIQLCQSGLTKVVTFTPFYLVSNLGKTDIEVREEGLQEWTTISAEKVRNENVSLKKISSVHSSLLLLLFHSFKISVQCAPIWPKQSTAKKYICARYSGTTEESLMFPITENFETLSKIDSDVVGMQASVSTCESSVAIHLSPFLPGMTPVMVMNALKVLISNELIEFFPNTYSKVCFKLFHFLNLETCNV
ncbi:hypothetical protein WR25_11522 isoform B [Diploscapter pachys]|uniref:Vacuolar protein sorting-associated protein 13 n=1 Tax=Diploscapter pachys TaxID=2018661 RepID=A0A2A2JKI3_9BILA|nr:hypothetical protein WR25_11522 isoform B [Diploscapter pachys]